ncbi:collagen alpha-2(IV) chain-like [Mastacembelus armatus]|nr:collagen alpha-2(IV) chain-like [Mastacembelus armatus]
MCQGKRKSAAVSLAVVFLICFVLQIVDCYRLKRRELGDDQRDVSTAKKQSIQEGKIVFGRVFKKGSGLLSEVFDRTGNSSSNASVMEGMAYQADFAGWSKGRTYDSSSTKWKSMAPSLQCGGDRMRFKVAGPGASVFALDQGSVPPMPLSQVPSTCGYHVQRNSLGFTMLVPYHGCNVVQENGSYVLPMRWQGIPVSLWCPKSTPVPQTASHPHKMPVLPSGETPVGSYPVFPPSYFFPPHLPFPLYPSGVLPTTDPTTTTAKQPQMPGFPQDPTLPYYPYFPLPLPGKAGSQSISTPGKSEMPGFPQDPSFPLPFYPYFPLPLPGKAGAQSTSTPGKPEMPGFPQDPTLPYYPYFPLPLPGKAGKPEMPGFPQDPTLPYYPYFPLPLPGKAGSQSISTPGKSEMPGFPQDPSFPLPFYPYFPLPVPGKTGTESNGTTPEKSQRPGFPQDPYSLFYPYFPSPFPGAQSTSTTPAKPQMPGFPHTPFFPLHPHFTFPLPGKTGAQSTSTTPGKPQIPGFPQDTPYPLPFYPYFSFPLPGKTGVQSPSTTTPEDPLIPGFPQGPSLPFPLYPYFPSPLPGKTDVPTTTSKPKLPFYPPFYPWPGQDVPPGFLPAMAQDTATQTMTPESQLLAELFHFGSQYPHFDLCDPKWPVLMKKYCRQQKP